MTNRERETVTQQKAPLEQSVVGTTCLDKTTIPAEVSISSVWLHLYRDGVRLAPRLCDPEMDHLENVIRIHRVLVNKQGRQISRTRPKDIQV